jgi:hypothetical protein
MAQLGSIGDNEDVAEFTSGVAGPSNDVRVDETRHVRDEKPDG